MEALEILEDLKHVLFQDFTKWRGYSRHDFSKAIAELEALEQHIEELKSENAKLKEQFDMDKYALIQRKASVGMQVIFMTTDLSINHKHDSKDLCEDWIKSFDCYEPKAP